jgi:cation diffusion facilitator family transporter
MSLPAQKRGPKGRRQLPMLKRPVKPEHCRRCARIAPWFSFWGNLALATHKLVVGILGRSTALVADAIHSFGDVIGSASILVATNSSGKKPDHKFPYGRGKAEFISAVFVYVMLLFLATGIMISSLRSILSNEISPPHFVTAASAVVSVLYNWLMYKYTACVGQRNNSPAIMADAFENRADAISSVAVIGGIIAARLIHPILDPIGALIVCVIIFWNCQEQLREATAGLMDRGMPEDRLKVIRHVAAEQRGVLKVTFVRTRQTGVHYWVDIGVEVHASATVEQADEIAAAVQSAVSTTPQIHYVDVYVSPPSAEMQAKAAMKEPEPAILLVESEVGVSS